MRKYQHVRRGAFERLENRCCLSITPVVNEFDGSMTFDEGNNPGGTIEAQNIAIGLKIMVEEVSTFEELEETMVIEGGEAHFDDEGRVHVSVSLASWDQELLSDLESAGLETSVAVESVNLVEGWIAPVAVENLAAISGVVFVGLPEYLTTNVGAVTTDGDDIVRSSDVRTRFAAPGIDGSGIRVGVISDGAASRATSISTGDLPSTLVVNNADDGDEGTAMLEIVHDLAPGASLYFAGAATVGELLAGIDWLESQDVDIIVDDLLSFGQQFFTDGDLANRASDAVDAGISYATSAGNFAQEHYQAQFAIGTTFSGGIIHRDASGDEIFAVAIPGRAPTATQATTTIHFQWSDAWGGSANDYRLMVSNDGVNWAFSATNVIQAGTQNPAESHTFVNTSLNAVVRFFAIWRPPAAANRELELFANGSAGLERIVTADSVFGHQAVESVLSVGAIDANDAGNDTIEAFSSRGNSTIYTNFATQTATQRQSLDGASIDGVETTVPGFTDFHGTSAAAPHVAGIAALLLDINPLLTPAQVSSLLATTAVDILAAGYDADSGFGRFNALAAAYNAFTPAAPLLSASSDTGISNSDRITNDNTPTITGTVPADSFVRLYVDGVERGSQQLSGGATQFSITPTTALTDGGRSVTIRVAESSVVPLANMSNASGALSITIDTSAPSAPSVPDLLAADDSGVSSTDNITNVQTARFSGTGETGATVTLLDGVTTIGTGTVSSGTWQITSSSLSHASHSIKARLTDVAGNVSSDSATLSVTIDITPPSTPSLPDLLTAQDTGTSGTDNITRLTSLQFNGTADVSTSVTLLRSGSTVIGSTTSNGSGAWQISGTLPANVTHSITARATDVAGNTATSSPLSVTVDTVGPRVSDVVVRGTSWTRAPYSFAMLAAAGNQLEPIFTANANRLQVVFNENVVVAANNLTLHKSSYYGASSILNNTGFTNTASTAEWSYALVGDKYRIDLSADVTDVAGNMLDGEWQNPSIGTPDNFIDDSSNAFPTGDGTPGTTGNVFQFAFSVLPGDTDQDGRVEAEDSDGIGPVADVNGDGAGNDADRTLINSTYLGWQLPGRRSNGDYKDDETIDGGDYVVWRTEFGETGPNLKADGNDDGTVDAADYVVYESYRGDFVGAWHESGSGMGGSFALQQIGAAPLVAEVTISGSNSTHAPFGFDAMGKDGSGEQLRTVPVGGADTISITFSEDVNVVESNLRLVGLSTANVPTIAEFSYDIFTMTATWRFEGWALGDHYLISLSDAVTDIEGNLLDGEWVNPTSITTTNAAVSEFPSGDGEAGGKFNFIATLLPGDANLDLVVSTADLSALLINYSGATFGNLFANGDFDGDGDITVVDLNQLLANFSVDLRAVFVLADLNGDSAVDELDAEIMDDHWFDADPTYEDGDLNGDGLINAADVDLLFAQLGLELELVS